MSDPLVDSPSSGAAQVAPTDETRPVQGPPADLVKREPRRAGSRGGRAGKRHVALLPMDLQLPEKFSLATSLDRLAVIEALALAIAKGRVSGLAATTLLAAVKEARAEADHENEQQLAELARKVEELEARGIIRR